MPTKFEVASYLICVSLQSNKSFIWTICITQVLKKKNQFESISKLFLSEMTNLVFHHLMLYYYLPFSR